MPKYVITFPDDKVKEVIKFLKKHKIKYSVVEENSSVVSDMELKGWGKSYEELTNLSTSDRKKTKQKEKEVKRKKNKEDDFVLTPALKKLLDERLKDAKENPDDWESWETVKKRLLKKLKAKK